MIKSLLQKTLVGMALFGMAGALEARAESVTLSSQFFGGPGVTVTYTGSGGTEHTEGTAAGAFTVTPTSPGGSPFQAFCVSLDIQVGYGPDSIYASVVQPLNTVSGPNSPYFPNARNDDVGNRLAYLLVTSAADSNPLAAAAAQLAIWYTIDKKFSYTGGTTDLDTLYTAYLAGYNPSITYGGNDAKLFVVDQQQHAYQNLIALTSYGSVPEPASVVSAVVGLAGVGLVGLRRRRKAVA